VKLTFLAKDPWSPGGGSPTLYRTDRADRATLVVQGWRLDPETVASLGMPGHEDAVEVPLDVLVAGLAKYETQR
jgi:hypothetical protein